jgi:ABC-type amino acid transport substrate-binding protein
MGTVLRNENPALTEAINCEIGKLHADGTLDELATKWVGNTDIIDALDQLPPQ